MRAISLHVVRGRVVVEVLTELRVRPVVDGLTARTRTAVVARWHTMQSGFDATQRLVRWRRRAQHFIVVWFHPTILAHLTRPRDASNRQTYEENADSDMETHADGLLSSLNSDFQHTQTTVMSTRRGDRPSLKLEELYAFSHIKL